MIKEYISILSIFKFETLIPIIKCNIDDKNNHIEIEMPKFDITLRRCMNKSKYNKLIHKNLLKIIKSLVKSVNILHNNLLISHCDIKPANIFINYVEENGEFIVTDTVLGDYGLILLNPITNIGLIQTRWYRSPSAHIIFMGKSRIN